MELYYIYCTFYIYFGIAMSDQRILALQRRIEALEERLGIHNNDENVRRVVCDLVNKQITSWVCKCPSFYSI